MKILEVLNDYVLVKPRVEKTVNGIDIPDSVDRKKATIGVVAKGCDMRQVLTKDGVGYGYKFAEGCVVLFDSLRPKEVEHNGEQCLLIDSKDILAIIEE